MLIVMKPGAAAREIDAVVNLIQKIGLRPHPMPGATRTTIGITGNQGPVEGRRFENLAGVAEVIRVTKPYKLITLDLRPEKTVVRVDDATIGGTELAIIAGPCAIESRTGIRRGRSSAAKWCALLSGRRVEAPKFSLRISRFGREGLGNNVGNPQSVWAEDCHR